MSGLPMACLWTVLVGRAGVCHVDHVTNSRRPSGEGVAGAAQVTCEFCKDTYQFQEEEVLAALPPSPT